MGDREHIKDTQSIIHRCCTNPLRPRATFGADQDDEHEGAFVEFQLGACQWLLGLILRFLNSDVNTLQISFCQGK